MKFNDPLTILRSTEPDAYGNPGKGWTTPDRIPANGFWIAGSARRKDRTVLMPPTTDIRAGDRVELEGDTWQVVDEPKEIRSPTRRVMWSIAIRRLGGNSG